jgi:septal ring factor EnvC (AmiA/AmiB activator)
VATRNREIEGLGRALDARNRKFEELDRRLDQSDRDLEELGRRLDERNREAETLRHELDGWARKVGELAAEATALRSHLEGAQREAQRLASELAAAGQRLAEVHASLSWRWPAPFRALGRALGKGERAAPMSELGGRERASVCLAREHLSPTSEMFFQRGHLRPYVLPRTGQSWSHPGILRTGGLPRSERMSWQGSCVRPIWIVTS